MTEQYGATKIDAYTKVMEELWRRQQGLEAGYWVVLNPDVDFKRSALYDERTTIREAIDALAPSPRCDEIREQLERISDGIAIELDCLPAVEHVFCEGPNPDTMQMMMTKMLEASSVSSDTRALDGAQ